MLLRHLVEAHALLARAIEVGIRLEPRFGGSDKEGLCDRQGRQGIADTQGAISTMELVGEAAVALGAFEIGQHVAVAPAGAAQLCPDIVVLGIAAHIDLSIDGGAAANHFRLSIPEDAILHVLLRHSGPAPAGNAFGHARKPRRNMEQRIAVAAARFDQEDTCVLVFRKPACQNATGRAAARDNVVVFLHFTRCAAGCRDRKTPPCRD